MDVEFHERIGRIIEVAGNAQRLADLTGISASAIGKYARGEGDITRVNMVAIGKATGFSVLWMATGEGPEKEGGRTTEGDTILLAYLDVRVSAGDGSLIQMEEEKGKFPFDRAYFKRTLNIDPRYAVIVDVEGDSMYPTFAPNDPVMVNIAQPQSIVDGVWVVRINETTLVKRIQQLPDGILRVISDNPSYEAFTFDMKEEQPDFALIGRVIWAPRQY